MISKSSIRRLAMGMTSSPPGTSRAPPGRKSFWRSTRMRARSLMGKSVVQVRLIDLQIGSGEAAEGHLQLGMVFEEVASGGDRDLRGCRDRVAVDAGADGRKGDAAKVMLHGELQRFAVAACELLRLAFAAAI